MRAKINVVALDNFKFKIGDGHIVKQIATRMIIAKEAIF
jgi:hypothetical protein